MAGGSAGLSSRCATAICMQRSALQCARGSVPRRTLHSERALRLSAAGPRAQAMRLAAEAAHAALRSAKLRSSRCISARAATVL
jgi:hypothetical protein